jgi:hypothetical protein
VQYFCFSVRSFLDDALFSRVATATSTRSVQHGAAAPLVAAAASHE